jgi:hypothetical protein
MALSRTRHLLATIAMGESRFLYGLDRTPDDRLAWSPGGAAKSPVELAAKLSDFLDFSSHLIKYRAVPDESRLEKHGPPTDREGAKAVVKEGFDKVRSVIQDLTESDLGLPVTTPWGQVIPQGALLWWINSIVLYYQGQLNYCQLAYGDEDPNIPPDWGQEAF